MPIDPTRLPALRQELIYANQVKPGGQEPDPGRVAAIEDQIRLHEAAETKAEEPEVDASNASTDYESHDAQPKPKSRGRQKAALETADDVEALETADDTSVEATSEGEQLDSPEA